MFFGYISTNCWHLLALQVIDLLNPGAKRSNLTVRWNKRSRAFVVDNLFRWPKQISSILIYGCLLSICSKLQLLNSIECAELDDLLAVLEEGLKNRAIGTHNMNEHSSRSHTILTVHIHRWERIPLIFKHSNSHQLLQRRESFKWWQQRSLYHEVGQSSIELFKIESQALKNAFLIW